MNFKIGDLYFKKNPSPEEINPMDKNDRLIPLLNDKELSSEFSYKRDYFPAVKEEDIKHAGYCDRIFTLIDYDKNSVTLKTTINGIDYQETIPLVNLNHEFISFDKYFSTARFVNREAYRIRPLTNEDGTIDNSFYKDNIPDYFVYKELIDFKEKIEIHKQASSLKNLFTDLKKVDNRKPPVYFNALNERKLDYKDIVLFEADSHFIVSRTYLKMIGNLTEKNQIMIVPKKYLNGWVYDRRLASLETSEQCLIEVYNYLAAFAVPIDLGYSYTKKRN